MARMSELDAYDAPPALKDILVETRAMGFELASDPLTGTLLRALAASRPAGQLLELGTGTGAGTCWLLDGMDAASRLHTVDVSPQHVEVAQRFLGADRRLTFYLEDGEVWLRRARGNGMRFDLIFADATPGKYLALDDAVALLKVGGLYVIDDMLPQSNWPEGHAPKVAALIAALDARRDMRIVKLNWSTGVIVATRVAL
jgi:predicted O-methyltransferase YrrM